MVEVFQVEIPKDLDEILALNERLEEPQYPAHRCAPGAATPDAELMERIFAAANLVGARIDDELVGWIAFRDDALIRWLVVDVEGDRFEQVLPKMVEWIDALTDGVPRGVVRNDDLRRRMAELGYHVEDDELVVRMEPA